MRPCFEKILHKKRGGGVACGVGPEFKSQYCKKKKKKKVLGTLKQYPIKVLFSLLRQKQ
jgi:hypothetical protein